MRDPFILLPPKTSLKCKSPLLLELPPTNLEWPGSFSTLSLPSSQGGVSDFTWKAPEVVNQQYLPKLFLPSVSVSVLCHDGWERPQPVLAGTYLPGQTPALQLVHVYALQALRDLSEGIQDGEEMAESNPSHGAAATVQAAGDMGMH